MKANLLLTSILAFLLMGGCKKDTTEKKLDTDILVSAEIEETNVVVVAQSEKGYPCMNYQISHSLQKNGQTYIIKYIDIEEPIACLMAPDFAKAKISIGRLPPASYPLIFQLNGIQTAATLVVDSAAAILIGQPSNVRIK